MNNPYGGNTMSNALKWNAPKSMCRCGHSGDGENSQHGPSTNVHGTVLAEGHGPCKHCDCTKFTWADFTPAFARYYQERNKPRAD